MSTPPAPASDPAVKATFGAYRVGFVERPAEADWPVIRAALEQPAEKSGDPLQGRVATGRLKLPHWGPVIVKHYARGGWMRHLSHRLHLRSRLARSAGEFATLQRLQAEGLPVPRPLLWVETGLLFTENWLILAEIPHTRSLADLAREDAKRAADLMPAVIQVVRRLIALRVHHVDFHPGNVLINQASEVFPIDFDKTEWLDGNATDLRRRYAQRWNRAIAKHGLPPALEFSDGCLSMPDS